MKQMNCPSKVNVLGTSSSGLRRCLGRQISVPISTPQTGTIKKNICLIYMLSIDKCFCSIKYTGYFYPTFL